MDSQARRFVPSTLGVCGEVEAQSESKSSQLSLRFNDRSVEYWWRLEGGEERREGRKRLTRAIDARISRSSSSYIGTIGVHPIGFRI